MVPLYSWKHNFNQHKGISNFNALTVSFRLKQGLSCPFTSRSVMSLGFIVYISASTTEYFEPADRSWILSPDNISSSFSSTESLRFSSCICSSSTMSDRSFETPLILSQPILWFTLFFFGGFHVSLYPLNPLCPSTW